MKKSDAHLHSEKILSQSGWHDIVQIVNDLCASGTKPFLHRSALRKQLGAKISDATIDSYRRLLTVNGYLSDSKIPGRYIILKSVPEDFSLTDAKAAYDEED